MFWRLVAFCSQAPARPLRQVTLFYLGLMTMVAALLLVSPGAAAYLSLPEDASWGVSADLERIGVHEVMTAPATNAVLSLMVALAASVLLMLPISWTYMGARRRTGFDQSVVQTMLILPVAIAGIVIIVKNSIALAFSLAGIVAGVRFRSALSDTADALYIFAAIGVGLAAGTGALSLAAVVSIFFSYLILILWRCDYGTCPVGGPKDGYASGELLATIGWNRLQELEEAQGEARRKKKKKKGRKRLTPPAEAPVEAAPDVPGR